jgi:hypothetical protein
MNFELRADPARAPGERNIEAVAKRRSIWPSIAVAAAAAAFIGVIWFAYQSGRDKGHANGPPLIKAEPGPVKVKPDNPGGQEIPFQDSTVYDRLGPNGQKPVMEKLLPPPEAPVDRPVAPPPSAGVPAGQAPSPVATVPDVGSPTALAPAPGAIVATEPQARPRDVRPASPAVTAPPVPAQAPPAARPPDPIAALITSETTPPAAKSNTASAYRIQLSAVRSPESVAPEWARLKRKFPELASLKDLTHKIDQPGKGVFYRLEAGPLDAAAAKSTCEHLRAQGLGCIVVKP